VAARDRGNRQLKILQGESLRSLPWLVHGFSTRRGGCSRVYGGEALNLGFTKTDAAQAVEKNRARWLTELGATSHTKPWPLVTLRQIHSDLIHRVDRVPESPLVGDGLISNVPGLALAVQTADCLPVILVDTRRRAVGVFHAGWRGTAKRIVEKGVGEMRRSFAVSAQDIRAVIGPGIRSCCYEVGRELEEEFESQFPYASDLFREARVWDPIREKYPLLFLTARSPGHSDLPRKLFLDLVEANRRQLLEAGLLSKNVEANPLCTACHPDLLFSHRAERGVTGRLMGVAGIRPV
jgi:polyphenol oxidase